ncbi:MAG: hypothetical protein R3261_08905, partial [Alphaproteobacteria bacterium]|nr:hypothetical protein [Alphaproteobacteria bacterium]
MIHLALFSLPVLNYLFPDPVQRVQMFAHDKFAPFRYLRLKASPRDLRFIENIGCQFRRQLPIYETALDPEMQQVGDMGCLT